MSSYKFYPRLLRQNVFQSQLLCCKDKILSSTEIKSDICLWFPRRNVFTWAGLEMGQYFLHAEAHLHCQKGVDLQPKGIRSADFMVTLARQTPHGLLHSFQKFSCRPKVTHDPRSWQGLSPVVLMAGIPKVLPTSHCGCVSSCTTTRDGGFLLHQVEVRVVGLALQGKASHYLTWADGWELTLLMESAIKAEQSHLWNQGTFLACGYASCCFAPFC